MEYTSYNRTTFPTWVCRCALCHHSCSCSSYQLTGKRQLITKALARNNTEVCCSFYCSRCCGSQVEPPTYAKVSSNQVFFSFSIASQHYDFGNRTWLRAGVMNFGTILWSLHISKQFTIVSWLFWSSISVFFYIGPFLQNHCSNWYRATSYLQNTKFRLKCFQILVSGSSLENS